MTVSEHENEYILCVTASSVVLAGILIKFEYRFSNTFGVSSMTFSHRTSKPPFRSTRLVVGSLIRILLQNNHNEIWPAEISPGEGLF